MNKRAKRLAAKLNPPPPPKPGKPIEEIKNTLKRNIKNSVFTGFDLGDGDFTAIRFLDDFPNADRAPDTVTFGPPRTGRIPQDLETFTTPPRDNTNEFIDRMRESSRHQSVDYTTIRSLANSQSIANTAAPETSTHRFTELTRAFRATGIAMPELSMAMRRLREQVLYNQDMDFRTPINDYDSYEGVSISREELLRQMRRMYYGRSGRLPTRQTMENPIWHTEGIGMNEEQGITLTRLVGEVLRNTHSTEDSNITVERNIAQQSINVSVELSDRHIEQSIGDVWRYNNNVYENRELNAVDYYLESIAERQSNERKLLEKVMTIITRDPVALTKFANSINEDDAIVEILQEYKHYSSKKPTEAQKQSIAPLAPKQDDHVKAGRRRIRMPRKDDKTSEK